MKGTKDLKTNKGITLIALVITIIVMLILVAVTISMAVNGGLFEYASNAGTKTNGAIANEQILASGRINVNNVWYDSIDAYIANTPSKIQGGEMPTKLTITGENIVEGKITLEVGDSITLGAKLDKGEVTASDIEWNNSNNEVVKVENGVITALNSTKGTAILTAKFDTLVDEIEVTVNPKFIKDCIECVLNVRDDKYYGVCPVCGQFSGPTVSQSWSEVTKETGNYYMYCDKCEVKTYDDPNGPPQLEECPTCGSVRDYRNEIVFGGCGDKIENVSDIKWRRCGNVNCVDGKIYDFGN